MSEAAASLATRLARHLGPTRPLDAAEVEPVLRALLGTARDDWPRVRPDTEVLLAHLATHLPDDLPVVPALEQVSFSDLYLACACLRGDPEAIAAFDRAFLSSVPAAVIRAGFSAETAEEVQQLLRERLLVGRAGPPRLGQYAGRGSLQSWVRVAAVREALRLQVRRGREVAAPPERLEGLADGQEDVELAYLKRAYRAEFDAAFTAALAALTTQERSLLRYHFLDGLTLDALGRRYRAHRTTIARRIARARERLLRETRQRLEERLGARHSEVESLIRLLRSQLGLSLRSALAAPEPRRPPTEGGSPEDG